MCLAAPPFREWVLLTSKIMCIVGEGEIHRHMEILKLLIRNSPILFKHTFNLKLGKRICILSKHLLVSSLPVLCAQMHVHISYLWRSPYRMFIEGSVDSNWLRSIDQLLLQRTVSLPVGVGFTTNIVLGLWRFTKKGQRPNFWLEKLRGISLEERY